MRGHHTRPQSRGGQDNSQHEGRVIEISQDIHSAFHTLFGNLRVNEIVRLLLTEWETTCPHQEKEQSNTYLDRLAKRIKAWDELIGEEADSVVAAKIIIRLFISTDDDRELVSATLKACRDAECISGRELRSLLKSMKKS